jgi:glucose-6-phosphate isomerase
MEVFEMVAIIVVFGVLGGMFNNYLKYKQGRSDFDEDYWQALWGESESKYKRKIADLEERVKVLERIVTDKSYNLKKQFDNLDAA